MMAVDNSQKLLSKSKILLVINEKLLEIYEKPSRWIYSKTIVYRLSIVCRYQLPKACHCHASLILSQESEFKPERGWSLKGIKFLACRQLVEGFPLYIWQTISEHGFFIVTQSPSVDINKCVIKLGRSFIPFKHRYMLYPSALQRQVFWTSQRIC